MKNHLTPRILSCACLVYSLGAAAGEGSLFHLDARAATGYRADNFSWNIAGTTSGTSPDILSELTWNGLEMAELRAAAKLGVGEHFYVRGHADYAASWAGKNQDSDYASDGRTDEFSRSNNGASATAYDAAVGVGYTHRVFDQSVGRYAHFSPILGYAEHRQNLAMVNGYQTIPATGAFSDLNTHYDARWAGPWLGVDTGFEMGPRTALTFNFEYHWLDYDAHANWNLRDDYQHPVSFRHWAKGHGVVATLGWLRELTPRWQLHASVERYRFVAAGGTDRIYYRLEGDTTDTRLNEAKWESTRLMIEARFRF